MMVISDQNKDPPPTPTRQQHQFRIPATMLPLLLWRPISGWLEGRFRNRCQSRIIPGKPNDYVLLDNFYWPLSDTKVVQRGGKAFIWLETDAA
jgi:hypothetical protein